MIINLIIYLILPDINFYTLAIGYLILNMNTRRGYCIDILLIWRCPYVYSGPNKSGIFGPQKHVGYSLGVIVLHAAPYSLYNHGIPCMCMYPVYVLCVGFACFHDSYSHLHNVNAHSLAWTSSSCDLLESSDHYALAYNLIRLDLNMFFLCFFIFS